MQVDGHKGHLSSLLFGPLRSKFVINILNASVVLCTVSLWSLVSTTVKGTGSVFSLLYRVGIQGAEGESATDMPVMKARP